MIEQHVQFALNQPAQPIEGFGGTFRKGWEALSTLPATVRDEAMAALFADSGAAFKLCRTPMAPTLSTPSSFPPG